MDNIEKEKLMQEVRESNMDIDVNSIILNAFDSYKKHGRNHDENMDLLVTNLIKLYYDLGYKDIHFDNMKKSFVRKYILNESKIEGVNDLTLHGREEIEGLKNMYEYMHSDEIEDRFNIFTIKALHERLFSCTPYPEFGGNFRNTFAYLRGAKTNICDWRYIYPSLLELNEYVAKLRELSPLVKEAHYSIGILRYLDKCAELSCRIIKIHPFVDGNGRTVRCFINKLMEDAALPSVYLKTQDRERYLSAMQKGMDEEDYSDINIFYRYKVCDSILELDINDKLKERAEKEKEKAKVYTKDFDR